MALVNLKEILKGTLSNHYAVGMFDVHNLEMTKAVIAAAEKEGSPLILALAQVHAPTLDILEEVGTMLLYFAKRASVPVTVHLDHAESIEVISHALGLGFTSVMYDGSTLPLEQNMMNSSAVVALAQKTGASVEAELGHVGGEEGTDSAEPHILYTNPQEAGMFVEKTGIDALAVSIGTVHGVYRAAPCLNIPLLHQISENVSVPLVLHGGSGLSDKDIRNCIDGGISKINIYTELIQAAKISLDEHASAMGYPQLMEQTIVDMQTVAANKIKLFGSDNLF